jgi:signal transduction histidine kinase/tetratricopeptide (TPR) repeat protein
LSEKSPNIKEVNSQYTIGELTKLALDTRDKDFPEALKYAQQAVRLSLNLDAPKDIYEAFIESSIENSIAPVSSKKEFADALHALAECESENSNFTKAIFYLEKSEKIYEELEDKKGICETLISQGKILINKGDFQVALEINLRALKISEEMNDTKRMMGIMNNIGFNYWNLGDNRKAFTYLSKSLDYRKKFGDDSDIAKNLNNLGIVYSAMGDFVSALQCYKEACSIVEKLGQRKGVSILYMNIGLLYVKLGEIDKALDYLNKSHEINKEIDYKKGLSESYVNIAMVSRLMNNYDEALKNASESLKISEELGDKKVIAFAYQEIFKTFEDKKDYKKALEYGWKCYYMRKEIEHKQGVMESCRHLCNLFLKTGELEKVLPLVKEALQICEEADFKDHRQSIYLILAEYYSETADYKKSNEYYRLHIDSVSNLFNEEARIKIGNLQAIFEIEQARRESEIYKLKNIDLADANKKLADMNQEKNEFLNLVSHDLKNPLNSIYGFSNLLVEDINTLSMEEISDFASNINISSMAMLDLVNEILNSELMDSGRYEINNELIDLNVLVKSLISMNKFQLRQKEIKIDFDEKTVAHVFSDVNIVKQILSNLLSNAIKFSPDGKNIFITISHNKTDSSTSVAIQDEGPGLTEEDREKLFVKFAKLSAKPTAGESSTGLGLSIVKKLTDIIGGSIVCESEHGNGAKFILQIPTTPLKIKK